MHSKPKLALAIITSPGAAFEEILERKLLGTAIFMAALTGAVSLIAPLANGLKQNHLEIFLIGKQNPICWTGLFLLYGFILHRLLNWLNTKNQYADILTIMGWSQMLLLLAHGIGAVAAVANLAGIHNFVLQQIASTAYMVFPILYMVVIGVGIQTAYRIPLTRGIVAYFVVMAFGQIALSLAYVNSRMTIFQQALPSINRLAGQIASSDMVPWLGAGIIGLILGLWMLGQHLGWARGAKLRAAVCAGLAGIILFGAYYQWISRADYYGAVMKAQTLYDTGKFEMAAEHMEGLLTIYNDPVEAARMQMDIADTYYLAGKDDKSIENYNDCLKVLEKSKIPETQKATALIHSSVGAVYDADGKYDLAIKEFQAAIKKWPEFRDPWNRMAVTYDKMGKYKEAIDAAKHSVDKLDSKSAVPWVAMAQAFMQINDSKQANAAIAMVLGKDEELAKKIGSKPEEWKNAISKFTRSDMKYPLEKEDAPPPPKDKNKKGRR